MKKEEVKRKIERTKRNIAYYSKIYSPEARKVTELKAKLKEYRCILRKLK